MNIATHIEHQPSTEQPAQLVYVDIDRLEKVWPHIALYIADVVERSKGRWSEETIRQAIRNGDWQLWVVVHARQIIAVLATELYTEQAGAKFARVLFLTGRKLPLWINLVEQLKDWARSEHCDGFEIVARKGYAKYLKDFKMTHVVLEHDLRG